MTDEERRMYQFDLNTAWAAISAAREHFTIHRPPDRTFGGIYVLQPPHRPAGGGGMMDMEELMRKHDSGERIESHKGRSGRATFYAMVQLLFSQHPKCETCGHHQREHIEEPEGILWEEACAHPDIGFLMDAIDAAVHYCADHTALRGEEE